ncbi:MAG: DNA-binding response regulator [Methylocystaceae bacterium]|nr:MAG: DNA-binding response regulator [Methylocystaceae bacterium]
MPIVGENRYRTPVLLIEDDPELADEISDQLHRVGYDVRATHTAQEGLEAALEDTAAVMVVDRLLGGADFLPNIETLRSRGVNTPVLVVSALSSVDDRILGLEKGGDDYLVKPFAMGELIARVDALARRSLEKRTTNLRVGSLEIDLLERTARRGERKIDLLPREFKILEYFMRHPNQLVTRTMLLENVWHYQFIPHTNVIDVHVGKVRRKIDLPGDTPMMKVVRGSGFILQADD